LTGTETAMKVITAHKILIASATIFFVFFGLWELNRYSNSNDTWAMARGVLYLVVALGFSYYLKNLKRWYK
jgi:cell division protein FtsW (lipid II flippase)